jgi:tRNA (cytidine/uridine-2'-O-)-methyltransferase
MFNIVLFEPEIPPNTGNIIRLASNTACCLHLIEPLGFEVDDKKLRRAGLDYHEFSEMLTYPNWPDFIEAINLQNSTNRIFAISTKGNCNYSETNFQGNDYFLFGPETRGLPADILNSKDISKVLRIPMQGESRSLNLSNAVAVVVYEALRQQGFEI